MRICLFIFLHRRAALVLFLLCGTALWAVPHGSSFIQTMSGLPAEAQQGAFNPSLALQRRVSWVRLFGDRMRSVTPRPQERDGEHRHPEQHTVDVQSLEHA